MFYLKIIFQKLSELSEKLFFSVIFLFSLVKEKNEFMMKVLEILIKLLKFVEAFVIELLIFSQFCKTLIPKRRIYRHFSSIEHRFKVAIRPKGGCLFESIKIIEEQTVHQPSGLGLNFCQWSYPIML